MLGEKTKLSAGQKRACTRRYNLPKMRDRQEWKGKEVTRTNMVVVIAYYMIPIPNIPVVTQNEDLLI